MTLPPPDRPSLTPPAPTVRPQVLLVGNDTGTRALARWFAYEYEVTIALDGVEGLAAATAHDPPPDLILTDVGVARLDGIAMVRKLKHDERTRHVPVIFVTAETSAQTMIAAISAGARAYLQKPVDLDMLERKVRSVMQGRWSTAPPPSAPGASGALDAPTRR